MSDADSPIASPPAEDRAENNEGVDMNDNSDKESVLSEIDEDQFQDYDPAQARLGDRPVEIDEDELRTLKISKKKRADGDAPKKPRERRREKKRVREDDGPSDGEADGKRARRGRAAGVSDGGERRKKQTPEPENEENLTPQERRQRALARTLDMALKNPTKRRTKKGEVDLEDAIDEQIASIKIRMEEACVADNKAREDKQPALRKLKLLPEVVSLLNRENARSAILDPDTNFLQSVKFFLEPLNDGSLPAYDIQKEIFRALIRLPIEKEALISSGIGKVVLFYTKSKKPEASIKRMAERLVGEWSRPILKRSDDYKKRQIEVRELDFEATKQAQRQAAMGSQFTLTQRPAGASQSAAERAKFLAPLQTSNRASFPGLPATYTVAPRSNVDVSKAPDHRPIGAGGIEAFKKMTAKKGRRG